MTKRYVVLFLALCSLLVGCSTTPEFTRYDLTPNNEWGKPHLLMFVGNGAWQHDVLSGKEYVTDATNWTVSVEQRGGQDEADRWKPDFVALGEAIGYLDGMWNGAPGYVAPETITTGKVSFTRYHMYWSLIPGYYPVYEIGNWEWAKSLGDWQVGMYGRCYPYRYLVQIRTTYKNSKGYWVPERRSDTAGHETYHFPGLGGAFHTMDKVFVMGVDDPAKFWIE